MKCGTTETPHRGRGLCQVCYNFDTEQRHKARTQRVVPDPPRDFAFPEPFTRTALSQLVGISERQVKTILNYPEIVTGLQNLSEIKDTSSKVFLDGVQNLKWQVRKLCAHAGGVISIDDLRRHYVEEHMSLIDLARHYGCTRQYLHKLMRANDIQRRDQREARTIALNQGKLFYARKDEMGNETQVVLHKININKTFFKSWSPAMAYVLGVIYTDGNLIPSSRRDSKYKSRGSSTFSVSQKEPELLEKVLALMDCDAKLYRSQQRLTGNPIHTFHVNEEEMYDDLLKLGLTPKKSLTLGFPEMPEFYVRHFIRGCWDGDGSVYLERGRIPGASFISGSQKFAAGILKSLIKLGLPPRQLYSGSSANKYSFRFSGDGECTKLFHVFYDDVPESMYLTRKFDRFKRIAITWEGERVYKGKPHFAIPEPFTRTTLSRLLKISARQVERIMESGEIVAGIQRLSRITATSSKDFTEGVRELQSKVNMFLYGWDDEGWDDLD